MKTNLRFPVRGRGRETGQGMCGERAYLRHCKDFDLDLKCLLLTGSNGVVVRRALIPQPSTAASMPMKVIA
jgi:hypothetical protein